MIEPTKADFKFIKFKVPSFSFKESEKEQVDLKLLFNPSGVFIPSEKKFILNLSFEGIENDDIKSNLIINVEGLAEFEFANEISIDEIPSFFYSNSIAITFPYLRAFISTLSLQSNTGVIMLGLMNFTNMGEVLKKNTIIK